MTINTFLPTLSRLTSIASRFTRTTAEAEDCAIIALERIAPRLDDFPTEGHAKAFLVKTARNAAIDAGKHAKVSQKAAEAWESLRDYSDERVEAVVRLQMVIAYGIPTLRPDAQKVASLWAQGMDAREIAAKLGLSEKTVRNQKGLIIRDLKEWVKRYNLQ